MPKGRRTAGARALALAVLAALPLAACDGDRTAAQGGGGDGAGTAGAAAHVDSGMPVGTLPQGVPRERGEEGRRLYVKACIMCHGERGEGTQLGPSLTDGQWLGGRTGTFEEIAGVVRQGGAPPDSSFTVPMPPRGDGTFTDEQIQAVAAYTYSISRR